MAAMNIELLCGVCLEGRSSRLLVVICMALLRFMMLEDFLFLLYYFSGGKMSTTLFL